MGGNCTKEALGTSVTSLLSQPTSKLLTAEHVTKASGPDTPIFHNHQLWELTLEKLVDRCLEELGFFPRGNSLPQFDSTNVSVNESS